MFRFFAYFYLFCWIVLAFLPYVFFAKPIYAGLLLYFTISALYYSWYSAVNYKLPVYFKCLFLFVFVLSLYGVALILIGDDVYWPALGIYVEKSDYVQWLITSLLTSVPIYVFRCEKIIDEKIMKALYVVFFISCIYAYYGVLKYQMMMTAYLDPNKEEFTITCVYSFLSILPLVILFKKKLVVAFAFIATSFVYCVLGAKRGPIILGGVSSILLILGLFKCSSGKKKLLVALISIFFFVGLYSFLSYQMETSSYFAMRIDQTMEGYTSGRDDYAKTILDYYLNSTSTFQFFLGIGAQGTLSVNESYAHNDWVGILLEQGVWGVFLYLIYWSSFVYTWIVSRKNKDAFIVLGLLLIIGFGKTIFSMYYLPITAEMITASGFFAITLGYYLAEIFPQEENILKLKFTQYSK